MGKPESGGRVAVLACALNLMVSVEEAEGQVIEIHLHPGGQGFWAARMAARLGATVTLVAPLGGEPGVALRALVEQEGIAIRGIDSAQPNGVWISKDDEGEPATLAELPAPTLTRHEGDGLFNALLAQGLESDVTLLTGSPPGVLEDSRYEGLAHDLHALGGRVVADLSGGQLHAALAGGLDIVKVAHDEIVEAGLAESDDLSDLIAGARRIREMGAAQVLVSRAAEPLLADLGDRVVEVVTPSFRPVNHRGAGDSMTGATAAGLALSEPMDSVLRLAVAAGALNVTRRGLGSGDAEAIRTLARQVEMREA